MTTKSDDNRYAFNHRFRGLAVIIVNKTFPKNSMLKKRRGSKQDLKMMKALFQSLDFRVKCYKDLGAQKMLDKFKKASESPMNRDSDCFVCVISTHGSEERDINLSNSNPGRQIWQHVLSASDGGCVYANEIIELFDETQCASLRGKPKLFFIQACRSRHGQQQDCYDFGGVVKVCGNIPTNNKGETSDMKDEMDEQKSPLTGTLFQQICGRPHLPDSSAYMAGTGIYEDRDDDEWESGLDTDSDESDDGTDDEMDIKTSPDSGDIPRPVYEIVPITCPNDSLVMHPVMSGKVAFRNTGKGSWMLYYLYQQLGILLSTRTLLPYLTLVSRKMALEYTFDPDPYPDTFTPDLVAKLPFKMAACITHRLTRDVYFEPKTKHSIMWTIVQKMRNLIGIKVA